MRKPRLFTTFLLVATMLGCTRAPMRVSAPVSLPDSFSATGAELLPDRWWTSLPDPELHALIERAMLENFSLAAAWYRLDQARAIARRGGAPLYPQVSGAAGAARDYNTALPRDSRGRTTLDLGLSAGYEIDLWGGLRAERDAARLDALATREDLQSAAITLSGEIAETWYRLVEQRGQLVLLDGQREVDDKYLEVVTLKFRRGQAGAPDVLQQRELVASVEGERVRVELTIQLLEHQLAVLVGRPPGTLVVAPPDMLPELPPMPETGLPAELVRRRPDVRAAELDVAAADRRVAAAIADRFPTLTLGLSTRTSAEKLSGLFDDWLTSLVADLVGPIVDGGRRKSEVERTEAVLRERVSTYGQGILVALREVEDALAEEAQQRRYIESLESQLELASQSTERVRDNYTKGAMDFTRYLTTLLEYQRLQRTVLAARRDLVLYRIGLYRALAGGWSLPRPEPVLTEALPSPPDTRRNPS